MKLFVPAVQDTGIKGKRVVMRRTLGPLTAMAVALVTMAAVAGAFGSARAAEPTAEIQAPDILNRLGSAHYTQLDEKEMAQVTGGFITSPPINAVPGLGTFVVTYQAGAPVIIFQVTTVTALAISALPDGRRFDLLPFALGRSIGAPVIIVY